MHVESICMSCQADRNQRHSWVLEAVANQKEKARLKFRPKSFLASWIQTAKKVVVSNWILKLPHKSLQWVFLSNQFIKTSSSFCAINKSVVFVQHRGLEVLTTRALCHPFLLEFWKVDVAHEIRPLFFIKGSKSEPASASEFRPSENEHDGSDVANNHQNQVQGSVVFDHLLVLLNDSKQACKWEAKGNHDDWSEHKRQAWCHNKFLHIRQVDERRSCNLRFDAREHDHHGSHDAASSEEKLSRARLVLVVSKLEAAHG